MKRNRTDVLTLLAHCVQRYPERFLPPADPPMAMERLIELGEEIVRTERAVTWDAPSPIPADRMAALTEEVIRIGRAQQTASTRRSRRRRIAVAAAIAAALTGGAAAAAILLDQPRRPHDGVVCRASSDRKELARS